MRYLLRGIKITFFRSYAGLTTFYTRLKFRVNGVHFGSGLLSRGIPVLEMSLTGNFSIGRGLVLHGGRYYNMIGRQQPCYFIIGKKGSLSIGDNTGISATAIVCHLAVEIGDNVRIGGNCAIYDTDFHDLDHCRRTRVPEDYSHVRKKPVRIGNNVFIGAHSTILKGVTIGESAIVGAGSVVTRDIPPGEIWGGNPAAFIAQNYPK